MSTSFFIAKRYLFAKKSHHVINIISIISVIGVMVGTAGLIIVLSVFNGFSGLVLSLYDSFDPDIRITAVTGKTFDPAITDTEALKKINGVRNVSFSLAENALLRYNDRQYIATIKGVDSNFKYISGIDSYIVDGSLLLKDSNSNYAVVGGGIAYALSLSLSDPFGLLSVYVPKKGKPVALTNPEEAFNTMLIRPSGIFSIQQDFDNKYVLVPLEFAREITGHDKNVSSIEIAIDPGSDELSIRDKIQQAVGTELKAETRLEQHQFIYKILKSEKWAIYLILSFILTIAIFNITGSLNMLIIDKQKDISTLKALGANNQLIRNIFLTEGLMITFAGAFSGMLTGGLLCFLQLQFGFIRLDNSESFLIDAYPVAMEFMDFVYTFGIVVTIGLGAAWYSSGKAASLKHVA